MNQTILESLQVTIKIKQIIIYCEIKCTKRKKLEAEVAMKR
jgi:hypothetical protein